MWKWSVAAFTIVVAGFAAVVVLIIVPGGGAAPPTDPTAGWDPGTAPPESATEATRRLASADPVQWRDALTPELAAELTPGGAAPPGTEITLDPDGWREKQGYAVATAELIVPGQPAERIAIGFKSVADRWLVTFQESLT